MNNAIKKSMEQSRADHSKKASKRKVPLRNASEPGTSPLASNKTPFTNPPASSCRNSEGLAPPAKRNLKPENLIGHPQHIKLLRQARERISHHDWRLAHQATRNDVPTKKRCQYVNSLRSMKWRYELRQTGDLMYWRRATKNPPGSGKNAPAFSFPSSNHFPNRVQWPSVVSSSFYSIKLFLQN